MEDHLLSNYTYEEKEAAKVTPAYVLAAANTLHAAATSRYPKYKVQTAIVKKPQACNCNPNCTDNADILLVRSTNHCQCYQLFCPTRAIQY